MSFHWFRTVFVLIPSIAVYTIVLGIASITSSFFDRRGHFAHGQIVMDEPASWPEGQVVVVIAVSADDFDRPEAPAEVMDAVASELATTHDARRAAMQDID